MRRSLFHNSSRTATSLRPTQSLSGARLTGRLGRTSQSLNSVRPRWSNTRTHLSSLLVRRFSTTDGTKLVSPPMTYISGEEMTNYCMNLILEKWIKPHVDTSRWEFFDLSCKNRDNTSDKVLHEAVASGGRLHSIFKEPTVTPSAIQVQEMGLKKKLPSPNGVMRRGWNGVTISRDTIHIEGMELGYARPVLCDRHAVGGEYGAGFDMVGAGRLVTLYLPDGEEPHIVDSRTLTDEKNAVVTYHNPLDNVERLAHIFFSRCLEVGVTPYITTKKTVFHWQEGFWSACVDVFDAHYKEKFREAGLLDSCGGELQHLISDAATMQILRWTGGNFGIAAHNYDGDVLSDEIAQVHRSPGFITSCLIGESADGVLIKEYEASHGTVSDMWQAHLRGEETSLNPLGLVEALLGAMNHAVSINRSYSRELLVFTSQIRKQIHAAFVAGEGTRDLCGPKGLTTEQFVDLIGERLETGVVPSRPVAEKPKQPNVDEDSLEMEEITKMFEKLDVDNNGSIDIHEFARGIVQLGISPRKYGFKSARRMELEREEK